MKLLRATFYYLLYVWATVTGAVLGLSTAALVLYVAMELAAKNSLIMTAFMAGLLGGVALTTLHWFYKRG